MAKRSPILGYNHNVRYRGLVFHVQTEDSGLLNPHLFTHLFHEGVIVSTRKLVYDAGSNEEAIKALMQAQHKAVMKDLRKGSFDDKIDQYLSDRPDLEPRGAKKAKPAAAAAPGDSGASPIEIVNEGLSEPIELPIKRAEGVPAKARTESGDRTVPVDIDPPTDRKGVDASAPTPGQTKQARTTTARKVSGTHTDIARAPTQLATKSAAEPRDSAPVIEIDADEPSERSREPHDTAVDFAEDPSVPRGIEAATTTPHRAARPPSHGAAALPARPPSRPIAPPVVTRPATQDRKRPDSDVIEVYSPPPASAEPPPGERAERPGQYSMSRKEGAAIRENTGRLEKISSSPAPARTRPPGSGANPVVQQSSQRPVPPTRAQPPPVPQRAATPATGSRAPAPGNRVHTTSPITNRAPSPATPSSGSGVVMTRPAVIVGAPPKTQTQRVRKAREDEGRGFGQGLISEKSLDEVILAYLSEDAEDK